MGIISVDLFITLDGVYQGPGGPDEDRSGGFTLGGWQAASSDAEAGAAITAGIERMDALLLGRKTYDIFAGYWPAAGDGNPIAAKFNSMPKFVVSRSLTQPLWEGTTALSTAEQAAGLKDRFNDIHVLGSGRLAGSLLEAGLIDRLNLFLYPIALGSGKRFFSGDAGIPAAFTLAQPPVAYPNGMVSLVYAFEGVPVTGVDISETT